MFKRLTEHIAILSENLKAAKQIGFTVPPEILARANKVIR
jgi:hypothetical protein